MSEIAISNSSKPKSRVGLLLALIVVFLAIGGFQVYRANAANRPQVVTLSLSPPEKRLRVGDTLSIDVRLNSNGKMVETVHANLIYPEKTFDFLITEGGTFEIDDQSTGGDGVIEIQRSTSRPFSTYDALVTTIILQAKAPSAASAVEFDEGSAVLEESSGTDILKSLVGGEYVVQ